jgi:hypothetical protein
MASAVSQCLATKVEPRFWHNSIDTIVPQECVGFYTAYAELDDLQVDVLLVCRQTAS